MWLWVNLSIAVAFLAFLGVQGVVWQRQERRARELAEANAERRRKRAARRRGQVEALARFAGDSDRLRAELESVPINSTDSDGRTALHIAYFKSDEQAVENLIALGANQEAKNSVGLTPREMGMVREALVRLKWLARRVPRGEDEAVIQFLLDLPQAPYLEAVRRFIDGSAATYATVVRMGREGSAKLLVDDLGRRSPYDYPMRHVFARDHRQPSSVEVLLNCGDAHLQQCAEAWARRGGLTIVRSAGWQGVTWGSR